MPLIKNLQFLYNQANIQAILSTFELVIFTKFHKDWIKIVDFSTKAYFWASNIFLTSVSIKFDHSSQLRFVSVSVSDNVNIVV